MLLKPTLQALGRDKSIQALVPTAIVNTYDPIEIFVTYFKEKIDVISNAKFGTHSDEHQTVRDLKRLLFCCVIDAMSDVVDVPAAGTNKDQDNRNDLQIDKARFRKAIKDYGGWPDCSRVCRPQLEALLEEDKASKNKGGNCNFDGVRAFIKKLPAWPSDGLTPLAAVHKYDPEYEDLEKVWPPKDGKLCEITHAMFLYHFRSELVHKFESCTYQSTLHLGQKEPYYVLVEDESVNNQHSSYWVLEHPPEFMAKLARSILSGLEIYFRGQGKKANPLRLLHDHRHLPRKQWTFARELALNSSSHQFVKSLSWSDKGF